jgi:hypothetical protein
VGTYHLHISPQAPNPDGTNLNEWGEFLHLPGEKFYDFTKIRAEIVRDTEAKTGKNAGPSLVGPFLCTAADTFRFQGISPLPINLRVFSPNGNIHWPPLCYFKLMIPII